jgi:hypothetical protein
MGKNIMKRTKTKLKKKTKNIMKKQGQNKNTNKRVS